MLCVYKLYVGLSQANCSEYIDREQVVAAIASVIEYDGVYHRITQHNASHIHQSQDQNLAFNREARESLS